MQTMVTHKSSDIVSAKGGRIRWLRLRAAGPDETWQDPSPPFLNATELVYREGLKVNKRRRDWTLGRLAAKELAAALIQDVGGPSITLDRIEVMPHADGWPVVTLPEISGLPVITLSLSHSRDVAFCAAIEGANRLIGADIEAIEPRAAGFAEEYFTPLENQFLSITPPAQRASLINAIWSGKEAALKAIRRGLAEDTRMLSCLPHPQINNGTAWLPMRIIWTEERITRPMPTLIGLWRQEGDFVETLAVAS